MIQLGLIGKGIQRTQVHKLHQTLGELAGIDVTYNLIDAEKMPNFNLKNTLVRLPQLGYRGVNITHPFKPMAFELATTYGSVPPAVGTINTLVFNKDSWWGENTDYSGFKTAYQLKFGDQAPGKVLMLGCGGVGRAIAYALAALGASEIRLYDVSSSLAQQLADKLQEFGAVCTVVTDDLQQAAYSADGLINATPIGMYQYPGNPLPENCLHQQNWAFDAVYTPKETEFVNMLTQHGVSVMNGFDLFLNQGIDAFQHFAQVEVDRQQAINAFLAAYPQK